MEQSETVQKYNALIAKHFPSTLKTIKLSWIEYIQFN